MKCEKIKKKCRLNFFATFFQCQQKKYSNIYSNTIYSSIKPFLSNNPTIPPLNCSEAGGPGVDIHVHVQGHHGRIYDQHLSENVPRCTEAMQEIKYKKYQRLFLYLKQTHSMHFDMVQQQQVQLHVHECIGKTLYILKIIV